jgi:hypothetical protein
MVLLLTTNYTYYTLKGIFVQLFTGAPDGHAADFALPRRKLRDDGMFPLPPLSSRTGCAPGFKDQTGKPASTRL